MKKVFLLLLLSPFIAAAQPFIDIASAYYQYSPPDPAAGRTSVTTGLASVNATMPLKIDSDYFIINPDYENFRMTFSEKFDPREFHMGVLLLSWVHQWNAKWNTAFAFIPRVASQFTEPMKLDDLRMGGALLTTYKRKENLKYKLGVYYHSEFFGPFFIPLLGIDWNINSKWNLFGILPGSMNLEYKINSVVHAGMMFRSLTNSYRTTGNGFVRVNDNHLKLFMDFYLTKNQVISIEAGHTILRKYRTGTRISGDNNYNNMNVSEGFLFRIAYAFRVRTDSVE